MQSFKLKQVRRCSSRIERWLEELNQTSVGATEDASLWEDDVQPAGTRGNPYLAYPHLSVPSLLKQDRDDRSTVESYIFVDDDVPQLTERVQNASALEPSPGTSDNAALPPVPTTPRKNSPFRPAQGLFNSPSPLRNFHLAFGSRRSSTSSTITRSQSPTPSVALQRPNAEAYATHSRGSSLSTLYALSRPSPDLSGASPRVQTTWKFKRASVMGHFQFPSEGSSDVSQPRPSTSSTMTHSSATSQTRTSIDAPSVTRKLNLGSVRAHSPAIFSTSTPSLWSLPTEASHMNDPPDSTKVIAQDNDKPNAVRIPLSLKVSTANISNFGTVPSVMGSPRARKKRKLIISGIPPDDDRRFEAAKRWCQSFGEVSQITRVPNGDLHVDFRKAEVADTVCRLQARVFISGVGSVCLSWFTGKRP
ncbi:hypothetical protein AcV5_005222 [Taiwanofungus camphoratus]|nr:hypothetical protein AcV5_005222 [Antrodia cinnamomea]